MKRKKKYRLYALPLAQGTVEAASKERFSRIGLQYALIYTDKRRSDGAEITEAEIGRLSDAEERWLLDCNLALIAEETKRRQADILQNLAKKVDDLEAALKRELEESEDGENDRADQSDN